MKVKSISTFSRGIYDPRVQVTGGCISSKHFILGDTKLTPYRDMETEALDGGATLANQRLSSAIRYKCTGQSETIYALGQVSTSNQYPKFYLKSTTNSPSADFSSLANGEDTTGAVIPGTLIGYKGYLFCLKTKSGSTYLVRHEHGVATTEIGAIGTSPENGVVPQMFVHPKDNKLYMASGSVGASYDGSTISTRTFSTEHDITSICPQGNNTLLSMVAKNSSGSVAAVWDGSITSSVLVDVIDFGSDTLMVLENIGDIVVGVSAPSVGGTTDVMTQSVVNVRAYAGGTAQIVKTIESIGTDGSRVFPLKAKRNNSLFFPMSIYLNGVQTNQIWSIYKKSDGSLVVTPDIKANNDTAIVPGSTPFIGLSVIGDWKWVAWGASTTGSFMRTNDQALYTATSSFESLVNPGVDPDDRSKKKSLKAISLRCGSPTGASHTVTVSYAVDGGAYATIYTGSSTSELRVIEEVKQVNKPFLEGREYSFKIETTGYGEIYEFKYGYEVLPTLI